MDLDIKRVLSSNPPAPAGTPLTPLSTEWGRSLDRDNPLPAHPRPTLERKRWTSLNGIWEYAITESSDASLLWDKARPPLVFDSTVVVPFSVESSLSGVCRTLLPTQLLWYRRSLELARLADDECLVLHFEAVDAYCAVYLNGRQVARHTDGYLPFDVDATEAALPGENILEVCVFDPQDQGLQPRGKQRLKRGNMWYTGQSGIWQSVWMEILPKRHIRRLDVRRAEADGTLEATVEVSQAGSDIVLQVCDASGACVASATRTATDTSCTFSLTIEDAHPWSCEDPYLYGVRLAYGADRAASYVAFRTVCVREDEAGVARLFLNGEPIFCKGILDQGYWPDGLMTAPADEALVFDLEAARAAGFNMVRKHIKVECERWYWHADRLGILVFQDMVSGGENPEKWTSANIPTLIRASWARLADTSVSQHRLMGSADKGYQDAWQALAASTVRHLRSHPSIVCWCAFNESWGQFRSAEVTDTLRKVDDSRPWIATSGWYDQGAGDFMAVHNYFRSLAVYPDPYARAGKPKRAFIINEFGGLTLPIAGHTSIDTVYGYDAYEDQTSWRQAFLALMDTVCGLEEQGLAGFCYTQLTDVEEETNGILTYDRARNKLEDTP